MGNDQEPSVQPSGRARGALRSSATTPGTLRLAGFIRRSCQRKSQNFTASDTYHLGGTGRVEIRLKVAKTMGVDAEFCVCNVHSSSPPFSTRTLSEPVLIRLEPFGVPLHVMVAVQSEFTVSGISGKLQSTTVPGTV